MEIIRTLDHFPTHLQHGAISIGNFDGVHLGHERLIGQLMKRSTEVSGPAIVFTFDPHPVRILRPTEAPVPLTWTERKAALLSRLGVDALIAFPATPELLTMSYQEFFQTIIVDTLAAEAIVEGPNFFFGKDRQGNVETLAQLCREQHIRFDVVEPELNSDAMISSSRVRAAVASGDFDQVSSMLSSRYRIRGMVTHGVGRGAELGFPTANVEAIDTMIPADGVYAGTAEVMDRVHKAAIHIGSNPTFSDNSQKIEVHLLDFDESIYGEPIEIEFMRRIREIKRFSSATELVQQIRVDIESVRSTIATQLS